MERKDNGGLYKIMLDNIKADPSKILHVGTKKVSDFEMPLKLGLQAIQNEPMMQQYTKVNARAMLMYNISG